MGFVWMLILGVVALIPIAFITAMVILFNIVFEVGKDIDD